MDIQVKAEEVKIIEVSRIAGNVLVTFSDGRLTLLDSGEIYEFSQEPPPDPDFEPND